MEYSSSPSLDRAALIAEHGNKQVGDARRAHVAKGGELLALDTIEQQDAAPEHLALVHRLQRPCCGDLLGIHHHFQIARLEFFHAAIEYDAAAVDEHDIGEDVLDLFHLMCGHHDSAAAVEVVESLPNPHPARQHGDVGNEAGIAHELFALSPGVASEHLQFSLIGGESENCVERGGLACAVGTDQSEDAALFDPQIYAVHRDVCPEGLPETACFYACHGFSAPPLRLSASTGVLRDR